MKTGRKIVPHTIPLPDPLPVVCGPRLLIRPCVFEDRIGSIILPDETKGDIEFLTNVGQVVSMGDLCYEEPKPGENRFGKKKWCKIGDYVVWAKYADKRFVYENVVFVMLNDDQVMMVIEDPTKINVEKNIERF